MEYVRAYISETAKTKIKLKCVRTHTSESSLIISLLLNAGIISEDDLILKERTGPRACKTKTKK